MKTTASQCIVRFGLLKRIFGGCLILTVQMTAMPFELLADRCEGELYQKIRCLNSKMKYVSVENKKGETPFFKITGANVLILPGEGVESKTGNLSVGVDNNFEDSTAGFVTGYQNRISGNGTTIIGGNSNVAKGDYVTISGGFENGEVDGALRECEWEWCEEYTPGGRLASATGGGRNNVAVGQYDVVIGGINNKSITHDHTTVIGGERNFVGMNKNIEENGTTIIGGSGNRTQNNYGVVVGGNKNAATGIASTIVGGGKDENNGGVSSGDYATVIGGSYQPSALSDYSLVAGTVSGGAQRDAFGTNIGSEKSSAGGTLSTVCGGHHALSEGDYSTVHGGWKVESWGPYSSATGGHWLLKYQEMISYTYYSHSFTGGDFATTPLNWFPSFDE